MQTLIGSPTVARTALPAPALLLEVFKQYFCSTAKLRKWWPEGLAKKENRPFYQRFFSPPVTLWYLIFQRLSFDKSLGVVTLDARNGGADGLHQVLAKEAKKSTKPIARLKSDSTSAYSQARTALPVEVVRKAFVLLSGRIVRLRQKRCASREPAATSPAPARRAPELLDGSSFAARPHGDIAEHFGKATNQHERKDYWCLMRVVASFCSVSGAVTGVACGAWKQSEGFLSWKLMAEALQGTLYVADRNFGIYSVVERAHTYGHDVIVRLQEHRARRLLGKQRLRESESEDEAPIQWSPSRHDQLAEGAEKKTIAGRLVHVRLQRNGFRPILLWLFTTLRDKEAYPIQQLVRWYGLRWHAELDFRYLKAQLAMDSFELKSSAMLYKEFYASLIGYNLVRLFMYQSALEAGISSLELSFSKCRRILFHWLMQWLRQDAAHHRALLRERVADLLARLGKCRLPKRKQPRPSEPRKVRYRNKDFPPLSGDRQAERDRLNHPAIS